LIFIAAIIFYYRF